MKRNLHADLAICEAATPGPLSADADEWPGNENLRYWVNTHEDGIGCFLAYEDAKFFAEAREGWPEAMRIAIAAEAENKRLRTELKVESLRAAEWEGAAIGCVEMWRKLREVVLTNATGGGGENINDYDIMLNVMDDIESEVSEDGAA
ncbi:hypothetical protein ACFQ3Y_24745 [Paenibacillus motobuensis]|uniref:hypothetical protein n=1 Tax=Paenibacillus motobuensis TaxID=295324 RepID=UPI00363F59E6